VIRPSTAGAQPTTCHEVVAGAPTDVYITCPWDTTRAFSRTVSSDATHASQPDYDRPWQSNDLGPTVNGKYTIEITVWNTGNQYGCGLISCKQPLPKEPHLLYQDAAAKRWREVYVINGVAEPSGALRCLDSGTRTVTLAWNRNPDPDIQKYVVQEKVGTAAWKKAGETQALSFDRAIEATGTYQYRVSAVRPAPTRSDANAVTQSPFATTDPIDVTDVTPPPTTATGGEATSQEEPGVTILGPPETSATTGPAGAKPKPGTSAFSGGGLIPRPPSNTSRPAPFKATTPTTEFDPGFTEKLPYKPPANAEETQGGEEALAGGEEEGAQTFTKYITVPRPREPRALLIPLAGGLALFVFAMQVTLVVRRRPEVAMEDDFGDWLG
jgi:hypothetical protein